MISSLCQDDLFIDMQSVSLFSFTVEDPVPQFNVVPVLKSSSVFRKQGADGESNA